MANKEFKCCMCQLISTSDYGNFFCDDCFNKECERLKEELFPVLAELRGPLLKDSPWIASDD